MGKPSAPIPRLLEFLRLVHRMERGQAFSAALGIDYPHFERLASLTSTSTFASSSSSAITNDHNTSRLVHYDASTKTLSAQIDLHPLYLPLPPGTADRHTTGWNGACATAAMTGTSGAEPTAAPRPAGLPPLSTFQAVIDDLTTWALVLADPTRGRAGASVTLQSAWTPPFDTSYAPVATSGRKTDPTILSEIPPLLDSTVMVRATADKVGQNLGFASAEIQTLQGDLICVGSQVKYLPMGRLMDFLQSSRGWGLAKLYTEYGISLPPTEEIEAPPLAPLFDSLRFDDDDGGCRATFDVTPAHASLAGAIHGGCQSILMELVARYCLQRQFPHSTAHDWILQSMSVDYLSPPSPRSVELVPELLFSAPMGSEGASTATATDFVVVPVQVSLESDGRTNSRGLLLFRAAASHVDLPHPSARL